VPTRNHPKWRNRTSDREPDGRFWIGKPKFLFVFHSNHRPILLSFGDIRVWLTARTITIADCHIVEGQLTNSCTTWLLHVVDKRLAAARPLVTNVSRLGRDSANTICVTVYCNQKVLHSSHIYYSMMHTLQRAHIKRSPVHSAASYKFIQYDLNRTNFTSDEYFANLHIKVLVLRNIFENFHLLSLLSHCWIRIRSMTFASSYPAMHSLHSFFRLLLINAALSC